MPISWLVMTAFGSRLSAWASRSISSLGSNHNGRTMVMVGAAVDLGKLVRTCAEAAWPAQKVCGVPASVGGALCMNAGTVHAWLFDFVSRVRGPAR